MVGRCSDTGGSKEGSEQSEEGTFKLSNAVGGNEIGNAESSVYKNWFGDGLGSDGRNRDGQQVNRSTRVMRYE